MGGMSQLVQFAGALMHGPDLIILDEPFSGLDPLNVHLMKEIISEQSARVLSFIPITAPVTVALRLGEKGLSVPELLASLTVTLLGGIILLWISARVFRAGILLYGQRMTLGNMWRALRQA